jgi:hypothetical protein
MILKYTEIKENLNRFFYSQRNLYIADFVIVFVLSLLEMLRDKYFNFKIFSEFTFFGENTNLIFKINTNKNWNIISDNLHYDK